MRRSLPYVPYGFSFLQLVRGYSLRRFANASSPILRKQTRRTNHYRQYVESLAIAKRRISKVELLAEWRTNIEWQRCIKHDKQKGGV